MVEEIEKFTTKLQVNPFGNLRVFEESKIPIVDSRPVEKPPPGVTLGAQGRRTKRCGTEVLASGLPRIGYVERPDKIWSVYWKGDGPAKTSTEQGLIICFDNRYRKAGREARDAANGPTVRQSFRTA